MRNDAFEQILEEAREIHSNKRADYANSDPFGNFREAERVGIPAHIGAFVRLSDKYTRCCNLLSGNTAQVKDESVEDTLMDLLVYAGIVLALFREQQCGNNARITGTGYGNIAIIPGGIMYETEPRRCSSCAFRDSAIDKMPCFECCKPRHRAEKIYWTPRWWEEK